MNKNAEKHEFRDQLERMMRIAEMEIMLCMGDFYAHVEVMETLRGRCRQV